MSTRAPRRLLSCTLLLLSLACAGTKPTAERAPAAMDCAALVGHGFTASESPYPTVTPPASVFNLDDQLAWYRAEPSTWSHNLGFAMALDRHLESGLWAEDDRHQFALDPKGPVPPGAEAARRAAQEAYQRAVQSGGEFLTLGMRPFVSREQGLSFQTVALWACGRNFPVYMHPGQSVEGVLVAPDRGRLAVVHVGERRYGGAIVPLSLDEVEIVVVDLRTFTTTVIPVKVGTEFSFESIALAWTSPTRLRLRLKASWPEDKRIYAACDVDALPCVLPTAPTPVEVDFPRSGVLEVTSRSAFLLEAIPQGFQPPANLAPRSVHVSPDQRWVSFVTEEDDANELLPATRRLWVRPLSGGQDVEVARGERALHARWLDAEHLVFEPPEQPTPQLAEAMASLRGSPELKAEAKSMAEEEGRPEQAQRLFDWLVQQNATRQFGDRRKSAPDLWRLPLHRYSVRTRETVEHHPGPARLWGHMGGPTRHRKGPTHEVPAD